MDQLIHQLALVSEVADISPSSLARAGAALQKQVMRDFRPVWNVLATVDAFPALEDVPLGYWPIIIRDDIGFPGAAGIHLDNDGQPFALVQYSDNWTLTTSHEILEMLADPFGNRLVAGDSIMPGQGRVEYLLEVCDPSEDAAFSYRVNGLMVSDFYTPSFFDPVAAPGVRYSFTGAITKPRQVLKGGYLSWHDPMTNHWFQQTWFSGNKPKFKDLGTLTATASIRSEIDRLTPIPEHLGKGLPSSSPLLAATATSTQATEEAASSKAQSWHAQIETLKQMYGQQN
jgi:hypothetical protein